MSRRYGSTVTSRCLILAVSVTLILLLFAGCSKGKDVGSKDLLDFDEQEEKRLGTASPTPAEASKPAPGATQPVPAASQKPSPPPVQQTFFDVVLVANHPYFEPGDEIVIGRGTTLRVTNKDATPERPQRSFTADGGAFDSGMLKPGQVWTFKFDSPGSWRVIDKAAPFISAKLEVR